MHSHHPRATIFELHIKPRIVAILTRTQAGDLPFILILLSALRPTTTLPL